MDSTTMNPRKSEMSFTQAGPTPVWKNSTTMP